MNLREKSVKEYLINLKEVWKGQNIYIIRFPNVVSTLFVFYNFLVKDRYLLMNTDNIVTLFISLKNAYIWLRFATTKRNTTGFSTSHFCR